MKEEITKDQKEIHSQTADQIKKVEAQLKAGSIGLEGLRNRSMRSTLVFKNIYKRGMKWDMGRYLSHTIKFYYHKARFIIY